MEANTVSISDFLGVLALIAAIVGIAVAVYYGRLALNPPKRLIQWHFEKTPLISNIHDRYLDAVEVRILGQKVNDPHLGKLTVANKGRHDIDSSSFDQGRPIQFQVLHSKKVTTFIERDENPPGLRVQENSIFMGPELLHSKSKWTVSFVTDGPPEVQLLSSHLINVKLVSAPPNDDQKAVDRGNSSRSDNERALIAATISGISTIIIALIYVIGPHLW